MPPLGEAAEWIRGLALMGCPFVELIPNGKKPKYRSDVGQRGLSCALAWVHKGIPFGFLPMFPLWILDVDSVEQVERIEETLMKAGLFPPKVNTPSGGSHFYFLLPDGFRIEGLKAHLCHPLDEDGFELAMDFKLGPHTLLRAPGTVRDGRPYEPTSPWRTPPIADPRMFLPHGEFWKEPPRPFLPNPRLLPDRLAAAHAYLKGKARISISGKRGGSTLAGVCSYLVSHLRLDPRTAQSLLTHGPNSWNSRCTHQNGKPYPWSETELRTACKAAVGTISEASVNAYIREQVNLKFKGNLAEMVAMLKASLTRSEMDRVRVDHVRRLFGWFGVVDRSRDSDDAVGLTPKALGSELANQGIKRIHATHARIQSIPRLDYQSMVGAILNAKRTAMQEEGRLTGCPLLKGIGGRHAVPVSIAA